MNRRNFSVLLLPTLGALLVASSASAQTICQTVNAGDASVVSAVMILSSQPNTNFDSYDALFTGVGKGDFPGDTLIRLDVSSIPSNALVTSATVTMQQNASNGANLVTVHPILGGWNPATATWDDFSAGFAPAPIAQYTSTSGGQAALPFDVTSIAQQWVDGAITNEGLLLEQAAGVTYYHGAADNLPMFTICYVPLTCETIQQANGLEESAVMILDSSPNTNWDSYAGFFTGWPKGGGNEGVTLLRYDLSSIESNAIVQSAIVNLVETSALSANTVNVHDVLGGWNPVTVTWDDFSAGYNPSPAATFTTVLDPTGAHKYPLSFDLTALSQLWVSGANANNGVLLEEAAGRTYYAADPALSLCYYAP